MLAFLFPGQGSQFAGMGKDLVEASAAAAEVFRTCDRQLGFSLTDIMFGDDAAALLPTEIQQPAIFVHSIAAFAALCERLDCRPAMVAGHSLGEYAAATAAGCMSVQDGIRLVRVRGELMAAAAADVGGAMAAIIGMETAQVEEIVREASAHGVLAVANYNCPGQVVISGEAAAVAVARDLARQRAGKAIPLKVTGAFHSPLMAPAAERLRPHIEAAALGDATVPLVSNVDATPRTDAAGIKAALVAQVTGSVRWEDSIRRMIADGVRTFVELGPGTVLTKMLARIDDSVAAHNISAAADVEAVASALR